MKTLEAALRVHLLVVSKLETADKARRRMSQMCQMEFVIKHDFSITSHAASVCHHLHSVSTEYFIMTFVLTMTGNLF